ncbi:MAG: DNA primase [Roseofilum sp. Belize BBD 4]|uniref:DNA primase n=1 Tax=Roseofilum sp. Belize BBD 4 TaxID=2821500 RepID=UPI001B191DDB|nr:DNA primase [Roseofilum sp. Belize BBD 4]MBP0034151.1 DNA primase [Roseofilum sp. Belize BBD 4]
MSTPRLHPDTIEEIKQRVDIVELISERVVLKKRGREFVGLCPFHEEKSPSFTVSPTKQMFYCFGCGTGGNAISFLKQLDTRSFSEVVLDLARRYEVPIRTLDVQEREEFQRQLSLQEQLYEVVAIAASFFQHALHQPEAQEAMSYLKEQRGLSEETIQGFGLGYAPAGWQTLYRYLVELKGYSVKVVEQAGLAIERKSGASYYDRFRDRLMIPINDVQGRVVGFGGRSLGEAQPKYLNSPETPIFDKGNLLFGLDRAKKAISKQDRAIVVEGYFDAIALHAAGISEAVASLGTTLSASQVKKLVRYTPSKSIVLNFDADQAGTTATERAISEISDLVYHGQIQLRILNLPQGKDADEFLKSAGSPEPYLDLVQQAPLWLDWKIEQTLKGKDLKAADRFQQVAQEWVKLLSKIEDPTTRTYYINLCAEYLSQGNSDRLKFIAEDLVKQIQRLRRTPKTKTDPKIPKIEVKITPEDRLLFETESLILRIYLHAPEAREYFLQIMGDCNLLFQCAPHRFLWSQIESLRETLPVDSPDLVSKLQDGVGQFPNYSEQFHPLIYLQEKHIRDIQKPILSINKAALTLEQILCSKRRSYAAERLAKIDPKLDRRGYEYFTEQLVYNKQREKECERLRGATVTELVGRS